MVHILVSPHHWWELIPVSCHSAFCQGEQWQLLAETFCKSKCSFVMSLIFSLETAAEGVVSIHLTIPFLSALVTEKKLDLVQLRWWKLHLQVVFCAPVELAPALVRQFSPLRNCYLGLFADLARARITWYLIYMSKLLFKTLEVSSSWCALSVNYKDLVQYRQLALANGICI